MTFGYFLLAVAVAACLFLAFEVGRVYGVFEYTKYFPPVELTR